MTLQLKDWWSNCDLLKILGLQNLYSQVKWNPNKICMWNLTMTLVKSPSVKVISWSTKRTGSKTDRHTNRQAVNNMLWSFDLETWKMYEIQVSNGRQMDRQGCKNTLSINLSIVKVKILDISNKYDLLTECKTLLQMWN